MNVGFPDIDFDHYHQRELPRLLESGRGLLAARAVDDLPALAFRVGDSAYTYYISDSAVRSKPGDEGAKTIIGLSPGHWQDLVHDLESAPGLLYNNLLESISGDSFQLMRWEPALRAMYSGIPPYEPAMAELRDGGGRALAADQSFSLADRDDAMAEYLEAAGYLLVKDVFSEDEVEAFRVQAEILRGQAVEGDKVSWWGKNAGGDSVLTRVLTAGSQPAFAPLYRDVRIARLGQLPPHELHPTGADKVDGVTVVYKNPDMKEGLSDLPWHRDCGMGGHAIMCPQIVLSIYLYDATPESGSLEFLPGSHRACVGFFDPADPRAPTGVTVAAHAGDVTLHYSDVMHAAPAPRSSVGPFRQSVLLSFAPRFKQHRGGRHYNDVLLETAEDGQIEHLGHTASRR